MNSKLKEVCKAIFDLNLDPIKEKLMHVESGEGWTLEQVKVADFEYRRFLCLTKLYPNEQMAPLTEVDIFWHYHILDTMKYAIDCEKIFGYFLHHYPYVGLGGEDEAAEHHQVGARMHELYAATFGQDIRTAKSKFAYCSQASNDSKYGVSAQMSAESTSYCSQASSGEVVTAYCSQAPIAANIAYCSQAPIAANTAYCSQAPIAANTAYCSQARSATAMTSYCSQAPSTARLTTYCSQAIRPTLTTYCSQAPRAAITAYCSQAPSAKGRTSYCSQAPSANDCSYSTRSILLAA